MIGSSNLTVESLDLAQKKRTLSVAANKSQNKDFGQIFERKVQAQKEPVKEPVRESRAETLREEKRIESAKDPGKAEKPAPSQNGATRQQKLQKLQERLEALNQEIEEAGEKPEALVSLIQSLEQVLSEFTAELNNPIAVPETSETTQKQEGTAVPMQMILVMVNNESEVKPTVSPDAKMTEANDSVKLNGVFNQLEKMLEKLSAKLQEVDNGKNKTLPIPQGFIKNLEELVSQMKQVDVGTEAPKAAEQLGKLSELLQALNPQGPIKVRVAESKPEVNVAPTATEAEPEKTDESPAQGLQPVKAEATPPKSSTTPLGESDGEPTEKSTVGSNTSLRQEHRNDESEEQPIRKSSDTELKATVKPEGKSELQKAQAQAVQQSVQAFKETMEALRETGSAKTVNPVRVMDQVTEAIKMQWRPESGKSEMVLQLKPESLGQVSLKLSIEKGIVMAEFQVDSQTVKQAMESNLQDLRSALQDKGFNVFNLDVSVRKDSQDQSSRNFEQHMGKRSERRIEASAMPIEKVLASLESAQQNSSIDYLG